jgi:hypothetical protein
MKGKLVMKKSKKSEYEKFALVMWDSIEYDDMGYPLPAKPPYTIPLVMKKGKIIGTVRDFSPLQVAAVASNQIKAGFDMTIKSKYKLSNDVTTKLKQIQSD